MPVGDYYLTTNCTNGTAWPQVWQCEWMNNNTPVTTFQGISTNAVWPAWTNAATVSLWVHWVEAQATDGETMPVGLMPGDSTEPADLTRRADALQVERRAHATAKERAAAALAERLTEEQRAQLARDSFFVVRGSAGGVYRVPKGEYGRTKRMEGDDTVEHLCVHPTEAGYPDEDAMLTTKLWLETDEPGLRKIANITRVA